MLTISIFGRPPLPLKGCLDNNRLGAADIRLPKPSRCPNWGTSALTLKVLALLRPKTQAWSRILNRSYGFDGTGKRKSRITFSVSVELEKSMQLLNPLDHKFTIRIFQCHGGPKGTLKVSYLGGYVGPRARFLQPKACFSGSQLWGPLSINPVRQCS